MVTSAIAHPSKSENLVYTILPVTFAIWVVGYFSWFTGHELEAAAIIASFLTLLLFESGLDEWFAKNRYRKIPEGYKNWFKKELLSWNVKLESWDTTLELIPLINSEPVDLNGQINRMTQSTVSSQIIASRLWRVRSKYFLQLSVFFIVDSARIYLPLNWISDLISQVPIISDLDSPFHYGIAFALEIFVVFLIIFFITKLNRYRHRNLESHIYLITSFFSLRRLITYDWLKRPEKYKEGMEFLSLKQELEKLEEILSKGNFNIFIELWRQLSRNLREDYSKSFGEKIPKYLVTHWAKHTMVLNQDTEEKSLETGRRLGWLIYYAGEYSKLYTIDDTLSAELILFLSGIYETFTGKTLASISMKNPDSLCETILGILYRKKTESETSEIEKMKMKELKDPKLLVDLLKAHNVLPSNLQLAYNEIHGDSFPTYWIDSYPDPYLDPTFNITDPSVKGRKL